MTRYNTGDHASVESWVVSAGRDRRPGSSLNVPPIPASNFVLGERRAYSRDDGTPGWEALEEIVGGLEGGSSVAFASGMAGIAAVFDQLHPTHEAARRQLKGFGTIISFDVRGDASAAQAVWVASGLQRGLEPAREPEGPSSHCLRPRRQSIGLYRLNLFVAR